jgi:nicotinamide-nucleotide amidase
MKAEIICIGTELLLGQIVDTNAVYLARELADMGIDLYHKSTVGDNLERVTETLRFAWQRADLLLLSGGLGPTQDDLTREAIAVLLGEELEFNPAAWEAISARFQRMGRPMVESNRRQALFPRSAVMIRNEQGTAPSLLVEQDGRILAALPGVPSELRWIWEHELKPFLQKKLISEGSPVLTSRMVRMAGIGESSMETKIIDLIEGQSNPTIAPYAGRGEVKLRVTAKSASAAENERLITATIARITGRLGPFIYGYDDDDLETVIGKLLQSKKWRLATAESCTGGLVAHRITNVPGSSGYYQGGVNCYNNQVKTALLGVSAELLADYGAVSAEAAQAMAEGVRQRLGTEVGLAITGIAGPGGATAEKPVGLVYIAVATLERTLVEKYCFGFDRIGNKESAAQAGLVLLWRVLKG